MFTARSLLPFPRWEHVHLQSRRSVLAALALGTVNAARGQMPITGRRRRRIVWIGYTSEAAAGFMWSAVKAAMVELGYREGVEVAYESYWAHGRPEQLDVLVGEALKTEPDVIVVANAAALRAAQRGTQSVPIIFSGVSDPVGLGVVRSLARPGGNSTGVSSQEADVIPKLLELATSVVSPVRRVGVFLGPDSGQTHSTALRAAADQLGVEVLSLKVKGIDDTESEIARLRSSGAETLVFHSSGVFIQHRRRLAELALKYRVPTVFMATEYVLAGGLISYGLNYTEHTRSVAPYVDRILRGAQPADLPVAQPRTLELALNRSTEAALGIRIPQSLLLRVDRVVA